MKRKNILIYATVLAILILAAAGAAFLRGRHNGGSSFLSKVKWDSAIQVKAENPFKDIKLNPFR